MTDIAYQRMTSSAEAVARAKSIAGLTAFVALLAVLAFVVETLSQLGVPSKILVWLVAGFGLGVPALVAIATRTISLAEFALAGRNVTFADNAVTSAIALFGGVFAIAIAAALFRSEREMASLALGLTGGCLVAGVLISPYFRRAGSATPGDFFSARFGSRLLSALTGLVVATALFPMLVAQLSIAGMIADWTLGIGRHAGLAMAAILLLLPPLLGGVRGITATALVQFLLALIAFVAVSIWMSAAVTGWSLPPVVYAVAMMQPAGAEPTANASASMSAVWNDAGLTLCVALGIAAFPALLTRSATARSSASARSSSAWMLLVVAIFCVCAATMSALAKFALDATARQTIAPSSLFDTSPWITHWASKGAGLVTICGQPARDAVAAVAACALDPFAPGDLAINPDIAMLAAPDIAGLPQLASMLIAAGCLVSTLAAASLVLFAIGASFGHDFYFRGLEPRAPVSRRLLVQRLSLLVAAGFAAYVAAAPPADYLQLALWSLTLTAAGLFPTLVLAIWWKRTNRWGALSGMISGFAVATYLIAARTYYPELNAYIEQAQLSEIVQKLGGNGIVLAAVPVGFIVAILISLVTPRPEGAQRAFAEALARPRDFPVEDERE